jgi:hypothetical protein
VESGKVSLCTFESERIIFTGSVLILIRGYLTDRVNAPVMGWPSSTGCQYDCTGGTPGSTIWIALEMNKRRVQKWRKWGLTYPTWTYIPHENISCLERMYYFFRYISGCIRALYYHSTCDVLRERETLSNQTLLWGTKRNASVPCKLLEFKKKYSWSFYII